MQWLTRTGQRSAVALCVVVGMLAWSMGFRLAWAEEDKSVEQEETLPPSTADHGRFDILDQEFATALDVTEACLSCHTEADEQLHTTVHWNWALEHPETGQLLGKRHVTNNSTLSIPGNRPYCATCHNGYGLAESDFDFTASNSIDCLGCHDTTGEYEKLPGSAGHPAYQPTEYPQGSGHLWEPPDLGRIARSVGPSTRESCGSCHFNEQNVEPVIHGSLPAELLKPGPSLDVHMGTDHLDFSCSTCHQPRQHQFFASQYQPVSMREDVESHLVHATCDSCHDPGDVHAEATLNRHTDRLACQTCHIPFYARAAPTMTAWDWSTAGRTDAQGKPVTERNESDLLVYDSRYGSFEWDRNVVPEYAWFSGVITYTKVGDPIDPAGNVVINEFAGSADDPKSRIWPLKRLRGIQPYDSGNGHLVAVKLYGEESAAFWQSFDWSAAIDAGMTQEGIPFSGQHGFLETDRYWLLNHTVAPADEALRCGECHTRAGRLAAVPGGYIVGRDHSRFLDIVGWTLAGGALLIVIIHGSSRAFRSVRH